MRDQTQIQLFGGFAISKDGHDFPGLHQPRLQALLSYLILKRKSPQSRRHTAFLFWPDSNEKQAQTNLRKLIHRLRLALPDHSQCLRITNSTLQFVQNDSYLVDIAIFENHLKVADDLGQSPTKKTSLVTAISLYKGDILPHLDNQWAHDDRQRVRNQYTSALSELIKLLENERDYPQALKHAQRLLQVDQFQESTYRLLMRLYLLHDEQASALRVYHRCATLLSEELGVTSSKATEQLYLQALDIENGQTFEQIQPHDAAKIPLLGRADEWQQLVKIWQMTQSGKTSLVLIQGEAGIGKTRLAEEMVEFVDRLGMKVCYTRAYAAVGSATFAPVESLLHTPVVYEQIRKLDNVWLTELSRLLPELKTIYPKLEDPLPMAEVWQKRRFFEAISRAVLAIPQPLLLHLDDLQWWGSESIGWLQFLLEQGKNAQLLVVGTIRENEIDTAHPVNRLFRNIQRRNRAFTVALEPLVIEDTVALVRHLTVDQFSTESIEALHAETEGNPFYTMEIVRSGKHSAYKSKLGVVTEAAKTNDQQTQTLPDKIESLINSRLAQLSEPARILTQTAAVIGRSFSHDLLQSVSEQAEGELVRGLDELWQRRIIREQGDTAYDFSHDYIRSVAYNQIGPIMRRHLHWRVAQSLVEFSGDQLNLNSAFIAAHYELAGKLYDARPYLELAGDYSASQIAFEDALVKFDKALSLLSQEALEERFRLHCKREEIFSRQAAIEDWRQELAAIEKIAANILTRDVTEVRPSIEHVIRLSYFERTIDQPSVTRLENVLETAIKYHHVDLEAELYFRIGQAYFALGKLDRSAQALEQSISLAEANGQQDLAGRASEWMAPAIGYQGADVATIRHYLLQANAYAKRIGNLRFEAGSAEKLGYLLLFQGEGGFEEAEEYIANALQIVNEIGIIQEQIVFAGHLGWLLTFTGDYTRALQILTGAEKKSKKINMGYFIDQRMVKLGFLYLNLGDYGQSERQYDAAIELRTKNNSQKRGPVVCGEKGLLKYMQGEHAESLIWLEEAISLSINVGDTRRAAWNTKRKGVVLTALGRYAEAEASLTEAIKLHESLGQSNRALMAVAGLADLALAQGNLESACHHTEKIFAHLIIKQLDATDESLAVYMSAYHVLQRTEDGRAEEMLQQAWQQLVKRANTIQDEAMLSCFWDAPGHAEVKRLTT